VEVTVVVLTFVIKSYIQITLLFILSSCPSWSLLPHSSPQPVSAADTFELSGRLSYVGFKVITAVNMKSWFVKPHFAEEGEDYTGCPTRKAQYSGLS
jgi:hypothetical protein